MPAMLISISKEKLLDLLISQLESLFGLDRKSEGRILADLLDEVLARTEHCFSFNRNEYYRKDDKVYFHPFHSGHYTIFLYFLSKSLSVQGRSMLADKVYYLNKALNSVDLYHEIELPKIFGLDHPVGTVLGRAKYSDFFYFTQNCTVGNNHGLYPSFGKNVALLAGATVIGNCLIGNNCIISAHSYIKDQNIPSNSIVFGITPNLTVKNRDSDYFQKNSFFNSKPD
jgi:serine O-acetyltransferase